MHCQREIRETGMFGERFAQQAHRACVDGIAMSAVGHAANTIFQPACRAEFADQMAAGRIDVIVPGVLALAVVSTAFTGQAIATGFDRRYGVLRLLGVTPLGSRGLLVAKAVAVAGVVAVQTLVLGGLGLLVMADRLGGDSADAFTPMGAASPGSDLEAQAARKGWSTTEVFPLALFALAGMLLFPAANDLLTMFVALELLSLPLYLMSGLARRRRLLSQEAALKYFLLGAFSSAFFLFGAALMYGYAGSVRFDRIAAAIGGADAQTESLLLPAVVLLLVGVLFKVGAVPFHSWTPDVYQGAPTPVTGFMAACTKAAAFGAMLRLVYVGLAADRWDWRWGLIAVAALTMVVGSVLTVVQRDVKRLLAYSSIAHAGFIMVGVVGAYTLQTGQRPDQTGSVSSVLIYLAGYGLATIGFFMVILMVRKAGGESTEIDSWAGLGRRHPMLGALIVLFMLSFAGIPATAGFTGKLFVFLAGWRGGC